MKTVNHKELSEKIAEMCGVDAKIIFFATDTNAGWRYITQDIGTMATLAIMNCIGFIPSKDDVKIYLPRAEMDDLNDCFYVPYADHDNDPVAATCAAIAYALLKKESE